MVTAAVPLHPPHGAHVRKVVLLMDLDIRISLRSGESNAFVYSLGFPEALYTRSYIAPSVDNTARAVRRMMSKSSHRERCST